GGLGQRRLARRRAPQPGRHRRPVAPDGEQRLVSTARMQSGPLLVVVRSLAVAYRDASNGPPLPVGSAITSCVNRREMGRALSMRR
ncbi:hypothetical protein, partial [Streptomyces sp. T21Q-yed]|uniref:hypothetical protein n=1 Tax=Streptomyces sp. T21Q-yed TaxID=3018441 RepID=UPI0023DEC3E4